MADSCDIRQKAKIKWAIEGDENSKFFHGVVNRKHANLAIKGIMVDGDWVDIPSRVKDEFCSHFASRFPSPTPITTGEIRSAVWACGENKSPRPDGFTFKFFRKILGLIGLTSALRVKAPPEVHRFSIRKANSYVLLLLMSLSSGKASVLVNGSPTSEFQFHCGLKQGDPLAPYLFILVMESLHLSFARIIEAGFFKGLNINNTVTVSHLFYADDAVFVGEWSDSNLSSSLGFRIMKSPFIYLGVPVGGNMSSIKAWDDILRKLKSRLSKWKVKTLSIGGRLTLLKSVLGSSPIYRMSIYKVPKAVLASMEALRRRFFIGPLIMRRKFHG
ncbi:RNA-directed DNA polymerase, eukaryota [Tanacetum coccineum]